MLWIKAFHIICLVTWFSGLFYLPRLFVYHAQATDIISKERFKLMERKLYYMITTPGALLTIFFGAWLLTLNFDSYMQLLWFKIKLGLVFLLAVYHIYLGKLMHDFRDDHNEHSHVYYRWINEVPALFLIVIVILAVVKPV